jgi:hypothetical protein
MANFDDKMAEVQNLPVAEEDAEDDCQRGIG